MPLQDQRNTDQIQQNRKPVLKIKYDCECRFFFKMLQKNGTVCEVDEHGTHFSLCDKHHKRLWNEMKRWGYAFGLKKQTLEDMLVITHEQE